MPTLIAWWFERQGGIPALIQIFCDGSGVCVTFVPGFDGTRKTFSWEHNTAFHNLVTLMNYTIKSN